MTDKATDHRAICQYAPCPESVLDRCKCCRRTFPDGHREAVEIDKQIKRLEAKT